MSAMPMPVADPVPTFLETVTSELVDWMDNEVEERIGDGMSPRAAIDKAIAQVREALVLAEEEMLWRQHEHTYRKPKRR